MTELAFAIQDAKGDQALIAAAFAAASPRERTRYIEACAAYRKLITASPAELLANALDAAQDDAGRLAVLRTATPELRARAIDCGAAVKSWHGMDAEATMRRYATEGLGISGSIMI
jgi:hypothetical protein